MPCSPSDISLNPVVLPPPPAIPGFGLPFVSGLPFPDIKLPDGIPEDFLALVKQLAALIPGGKLFATQTNFSKDILDVLASLLNQLGPYLAIYNFFQALLNMILCIMDVLCSLMNPFALISALNRLFKNCLPDFLNLFPWLALIAMIIALLLLLLALLDYLLSQILAIIRDIIENLLLLAEAVQVNATESDIIAAARKIAMLLCMIEQLFAILIAFQAIMAIIESLAHIGGRSVCSPGDGSDSSCCSDEFCPPFIRQNPDGLTGTQGTLIYFSQVNNDVSAFPALVLPPARNENWQFTDIQNQLYNIKDIITPINGAIYWPEGKSYIFDSNIKKIPYLVDMMITVDPAVFGLASLGKDRQFFIQDCVVLNKPYIGIYDFVGNLGASTDNGTVQIAGGKVFENDKTTPVIVNGSQANLNDFIHFPVKTGMPSINDGYNINNIEYTLKLNHPALLEQNIITTGCIPSISSESAIANVVATPLSTVISRIGSLPNIGGTIDCLTAALAAFRANVSPTTAVDFQAAVTACINGLKNQTVTAYNAAISGGASQFQTTLTLDPVVQFTGQPIKVSITLKDPGGTIISQNIPLVSQPVIASLISGVATFGQLSPFVYDGSESFIADLTSSQPGSGQLTASFENNVISIIVGQNNANVTTSIEPNIKDYQFVGRPVFAAGEADPIPRRDEGDVSRDGAS